MVPVVVTCPLDLAIPVDGFHRDFTGRCKGREHVAE